MDIQDVVTAHSKIAYEATLVLPEASYKYLWEIVTTGSGIASGYPKVFKKDKDGFFSHASHKETAKVLAAISALRTEEIRETIKVEEMLLLDKDLIKEKMMELALLSFDGEFIGQRYNSVLFLQDISRIVSIDLENLHELALELVDEGKIKLVNNVILSTDS